MSNIAKTNSKIDSLTISEHRKLVKRSKKICYIIDVSGSMENKIENCRKIDAVKEILTGIFAEHIIAFNSFARWVTQIPNPSGGTQLDEALKLFIKEQHNFDKVIILSDGATRNKDECVELVKNIKCKIDTIFVGDDDNTAKFFKGLANNSSTNIKETQKGFFNLLEETTIKLLT